MENDTSETIKIWMEYLAGMRTDETAIDGFKLIESERDKWKKEAEELAAAFGCFRCSDHHTALYCRNCADHLTNAENALDVERRESAPNQSPT